MNKILHRGLFFALLAVLPLHSSVQAQEPASAPAPKIATPPQPAPTSNAVRLTLQQALDLARKNNPQFQSALTDAGVAREDRTQSRNQLLPGVTFNTSAISNQINRNGAAFIANNGAHEYISQGDVHEDISVANFMAYRRTAALAAAARARAEIAARGLVVTVVQNYFGVTSAQFKLETARRVADEGDKFLQLTQSLEQGGEAAHSDVVKAELQAQDRRRQLKEAELALLNARLDFAVLIFPDFNDNFEIADDLHASAPLPTREEFEAQAARENPDIRAALSTVQAAQDDVLGARAGYLPSISLDYFYGIDAPNYATYTTYPTNPPGRVSNLAYSAVASLTLPLWNWGSTQSKVRQAELKRDQARRELSFSQRKLLAEMRSLYAEADTALNELSGLQRSAELAADSLRLTTLRYRGGEATVLEVVDAQTTFAQANANYQDGALRYRTALANLQTLTGVLTAP